MAKLPLRSKIILVGINIFFLSILISTIVNIFPLELYVSLLPYLLAVSVFLFLLEIMSIKVYGIEKKTSLILIFLSLVLLSYPSFLFINQALIEPNVKVEGKNTLKVTFHNKFYLNADLEGLVKQAKDMGPDIIGFAEVNDYTEYQKLLPDYPYMYKTRLDNLMGVVIFSKLELKDSSAENGAIADTSHSPYIKTKVVMPDKTEVNLLMTHIIAPIGSTFSKLKGEALEKIYKDAESLNGKTIVMGDFNTTPYSPQLFSFRDSQKFYSASKGKGILDTWEGPSFLRFQIDQAYVTKDMKVDRFEVKGTEGSDHHLIYLEIRL